MLVAKFLQCIAIHRIDMVKAMLCAIMPTLTDIERRWQGWCLQEAISPASLWQAREASAEQNDAPAAETWARPGPGPSPHSPRRQNSRPRDYTPPPQHSAAYSKPGRQKCFIIQIAGSSPQQTRKLTPTYSSIHIFLLHNLVVDCITTKWKPKLPPYSV